MFNRYHVEYIEKSLPILLASRSLRHGRHYCSYLVAIESKITEEVTQNQRLQRKNFAPQGNGNGYLKMYFGSICVSTGEKWAVKRKMATAPAAGGSVIMTLSLFPYFRSRRSSLCSIRSIRSSISLKRVCSESL